jgi:hypothetical protein
MARPTIAEDAKTFMSAVRKHVVSIGNLSLRDQLGWNPYRYWKVHEFLFEAGRIEKGRGRGGSVKRAA